jgi:hypothetical protein
MDLVVEKGVAEAIVEGGEALLNGVTSIKVARLCSTA